MLSTNVRKENFRKIFMVFIHPIQYQKALQNTLRNRKYYSSIYSRKYPLWQKFLTTNGCTCVSAAKSEAQMFNRLALQK